MSPPRASYLHTRGLRWKVTRTEDGEAPTYQANCGQLFDQYGLSFTVFGNTRDELLRNVRAKADRIIPDLVRLDIPGPGWRGSWPVEVG